MKYHRSVMNDHQNIMNQQLKILNYNLKRMLPYKTITAFHNSLLHVGIADHLAFSSVHISIICLHLFCI